MRQFEDLEILALSFNHLQINTSSIFQINKYG